MRRRRWRWRRPLRVVLAPVGAEGGAVSAGRMADSSGRAALGQVKMKSFQPISASRTPSRAMLSVGP
jgi:hypothetical protein